MTCRKHSIMIGGRKTSASVEDPFWDALRDIARGRKVTLSDVVGEIDQGRGERTSLSSAIRVFVMEHFRSQDRLVVRDRVGKPRAGAQVRGVVGRAEPGMPVWRRRSRSLPRPLRSWSGCSPRWPISCSGTDPPMSRS